MQYVLTGGWPRGRGGGILGVARELTEFVDYWVKDCVVWPSGQSC